CARNPPYGSGYHYFDYW
nr:immunoglobulin heavy chain junction region [Macaca mulatta]MOV40785.1 immunoglobulin heavy chain junction region [Macaca mulatta]